MARLILLNGAPGVGKSTVGRRWVDDHELALLLDVDAVRSLLSRRGEQRDVTPSWLAARVLALAMAESHLLAGHDVVVPQYLGRAQFIEQLARVADDAGADFAEVVLTTDAAAGRTRFDRRGDVPQLVGATESWADMHARLGSLFAERPHVVRVDASGDVDDTYAGLRAALANPRS